MQGLLLYICSRRKRAYSCIYILGCHPVWTYQNLNLTMPFFCALLQSLEDELVRETILQLVSLKLWNTLSFGRLQVILGFLPYE